MRNSEIRDVQFYLPFIKDVSVTGNDIAPAIENISYSTEHLVFLGKGKGKLTGKIRILVNEIEEIVDIISRVPAIELEVIAKEEIIWVLPHRIKFVPANKKR